MVEHTAKDLALNNTILRGVVGSTAHGTAIEGQDDRDEMGICIEPPEYVCGMRRFEQFIQRDQPEGVRSQPGDLDLTIFSLRKYCHLAAKGNPTVLLLLWLPYYEYISDRGAELIALRSAFVSRRAGEAFLGYLVSQRRALEGKRTKKVTRPELVEKYGFDTKFAMHALRLGYQGIEFLRYGNISLPVREPELSLLRDVRTGQLTLKESLEEIGMAELALRTACSACEKKADLDAVNHFLWEAHRSHWGVFEGERFSIA